MALEQLLILTIMVVFAIIHGLARWKGGLANSMNTNAPADSEWELDSRAPDPFEAVTVDPPRIVVTQAPRSVPEQRLARVATGPLPRTQKRSGAPPPQTRAVDSALHHTRLIPRNQAELRRAIALVAIFGPPRALDPPK